MEQRLSSPNDTGLFSSIALGQIWFPLLETELQQGWNECWEALKKTYFKKVTSPYAVYFSVDKIEWLESSNSTMSNKNRELCNKKGLKFYLWEPLSTYDTRVDKDGIYTSWGDIDIKYIRASELDSIQQYVKNNELTNVEV